MLPVCPCKTSAVFDSCLAHAQDMLSTISSMLTILTCTQ